MNCSVLQNSSNMTLISANAVWDMLKLNYVFLASFVHIV